MSAGVHVPLLSSALWRVAAPPANWGAVCDEAPFEVQVIRVGPRCYAAWRSETYVEFGLAMRKRCADTFVITAANGRAPGYVTTQPAVDAGLYEAGAARFAPRTGDLLVDAATQLVNRVRR